MCSKTVNKSIKKTFRRNSECVRLGICVTIVKEINIGLRSGDQMGEGKSLCQRRFRSLCWSDGTRSMSRRKKMGKAKLNISGCIHHIKMLWESMKKQLNSSCKISQDFRHCLFFKKSRKTWRRRTSNQRTSRTRSSSCQC